MHRYLISTSCYHERSRCAHPSYANGGTGTHPSSDTLKTRFDPASSSISSCIWSRGGYSVIVGTFEIRGVVYLGLPANLAHCQAEHHHTATLVAGKIELYGQCTPCYLYQLFHFDASAKAQEDLRCTHLGIRPVQDLAYFFECLYRSTVCVLPRRHENDREFVSLVNIRLFRPRQIPVGICVLCLKPRGRLYPKSLETVYSENQIQHVQDRHERGETCFNVLPSLSDLPHNVFNLNDWIQLDNA